MRTAWIVGALLLSAVVHALPATGVLGGPALERLYGPAAADPTWALLLRHRALLFALVALSCVAAIGIPGWRLPVLLLAVGSVTGFLLLAGAPSALPAVLHKVYWIDAALLPVLALALWLQLRGRA
ncbi:MAG: hypothetical protein U1F26_18760 [Lysobacterales bacterium]